MPKKLRQVPWWRKVKKRMAEKKRRTKKRKASDVVDDSCQPVKKIRRDNYTSTAEFSCLPDDVLEKIISYVPTVQWASLERVDRSFRRATLANWRQLREVRFDRDFNYDLSEFDRNSLKLRNAILNKLSLRAPNITSIGGMEFLVMDHGSKSLHGTLVNALAQFTKLESIDLTGCKIRYGNLASFLQKSASRDRLKTLDLTNCLFHETNGEKSMDGDDYALERAFDNNFDPYLPPLRLEKLRYVSSIHDTVRFDFLQVVDVTRLTTLRLMNALIHPSLLVGLIRRCGDRLQRLEFSLFHCTKYPRDEQEHLASNKEILKTLAEIETLNLSILKIGHLTYRENIGSCDGICLNIDNEVLSLISSLSKRRSSNRLSEFALPAIFTTDDILFAVASNLKDLKSLELEHSESPGALMELFKHLKQLENFGLCASCHLTGDVISTIIENSSELKRLTLLRCPDQFKNSYNIKDLFELTNLRSVVIDNYTFRIATLQDWKNGNCSKLETLSLTRCKNVCDKSMAPLIKKLSNLRRLDLWGTNVTDETLIKIASSCRRLQEIDLSHCHSVSTDGIAKLIEGCPEVKRVVYDGEKVDAGGKYRKIIWE